MPLSLSAEGNGGGGQGADSDPEMAIHFDDDAPLPTHSAEADATAGPRSATCAPIVELAMSAPSSVTASAAPATQGASLREATLRRPAFRATTRPAAAPRAQQHDVPVTGSAAVEQIEDLPPADGERCGATAEAAASPGGQVGHETVVASARHAPLQRKPQLGRPAGSSVGPTLDLCKVQAVPAATDLADIGAGEDAEEVCF